MNQIFHILLMLLIISCSQKKTKLLSPKKVEKTVNNREVFDYDTTKYEFVKSNFYTNHYGDIFMQKNIDRRDSLGYYTYYYMDSLMPYSENSKKIPLRKIVDLKSFEDIWGNYAKDKNHIYFLGRNDSIMDLLIIENADRGSFESMPRRWSKDKNHIYFKNKIIPGVDKKTFHITMAPNDSSYDKNNVFFQEKIIRKK